MRQSLLALGALVLVWTCLTGFKPFPVIPNGCPECAMKDYEQLVLPDGAKISVHLLAETPDFYVAERFGDFRVVPKTEVSSIDRTQAPTPNPDFNRLDVVILSTANELVVAGHIEEAQPGRFVRIKPWKATTDPIIVWYKLIKQVWRGTKLDFPTAADAKPAAPAITKPTPVAKPTAAKAAETPALVPLVAPGK